MRTTSPSASTANSRRGILEILAGPWKLRVGRSNRDFLLALAADFKKHGAAAIEKVRKQQPAAYMKICALLVPREMKLEHSGGVKAMTDEQLEQTLAVLKELIAQRDAGQNAKVIDGVPEPVPALLPPSRKARSKARRTEREMRADMGKPEETGHS